MKASELMVGDYLTFPDVQNDSNCPKLRVVAINEEDVYISNDGDPVADLYDPQELSGIPITPEILEKNGFMNGKLNVSPQYCFEEGHTFIGVTLEATPDRQEGITVCKDRNSLQYEGKIEFVHELQHALRLCGIEKEIIL